MKTAEEYLPECDLQFEESKIELFLKEKVISAIKHAQKEAYNQAIDQILKLMYDHEEEIYIGVFEDIEKLKK